MVISWLPLEVKTPAVLPVPAATIPLIRTVPSVALVIVSSFSSISPVVPVISMLEVAVTVENVPAVVQESPPNPSVFNMWSAEPSDDG